MSVANDIIDLIGNTPIIRINKLTTKESAELYAKLEWYNIGGSVKDRMAKYLIEYAEIAGRLNHGKSILEATSGNTGIALAMIAASMGYKLTVVMPESVSIERRKLIKAYGAELILSPGTGGTAGAIDVKVGLLREHSDKFVDLDQFKDPANVLAHYQTTAQEIIEQTNGHVSMVVVGVGTGGTGVGISRRLKHFNKEIQIIGVTPKLGYAIQGLRNPEEPNPTQLYKRDLFDEVIELSKDDQELIYSITRRAAREEGLLIGISSGAILHIALEKAKRLGKGKTVVAVLPDSGLKYLSTPLFED